MCDTKLDSDVADAKLFIPDMLEGLAFSGFIEKKPYFKENEYLIQFEKIEEKTRNRIIQKCLELEAEKIRKNN